jgi:hypothetical protein
MIPENVTTVAGSRTGGGLSHKALTIVKTAVLAPIAMARVATAAAVVLRSERRDRKAYRNSPTRVFANPAQT